MGGRVARSATHRRRRYALCARHAGFGRSRGARQRMRAMRRGLMRAMPDNALAAPVGCGACAVRPTSASRRRTFPADWSRCWPGGRRAARADAPSRTGTVRDFTGQTRVRCHARGRRSGGAVPAGDGAQQRRAGLTGNWRNYCGSHAEGEPLTIKEQGDSLAVLAVSRGACISGLWFAALANRRPGSASPSPRPGERRAASASRLIEELIESPRVSRGCGAWVDDLSKLPPRRDEGGGRAASDAGAPALRDRGPRSSARAWATCAERVVRARGSSRRR